MATTDQEQMSEAVPYHKRMAMGAKVDGKSMQGSGNSTGNNRSGSREKSSTGVNSGLKKTK